MVVALLALFVALGGGAYAAVNLPKNSVGSKQIKKNAVTSAKVKDGSLLSADFKAGQLPAGPAGRSALEPLHSGETIHGAWAVASTTASIDRTGVTFPVPAPVAVDSKHVVIVNNDEVPGDGCTGPDAVAAPGFVCVYFASASHTTFASGLSANNSSRNPSAEGDGSPYGFVIEMEGTNNFYANGTWAYTAP